MVRRKSLDRRKMLENFSIRICNNKMNPGIIKKTTEYGNKKYLFFMIKKYTILYSCVLHLRFNHILKHRYSSSSLCLLFVLTLSSLRPHSVLSSSSLCPLPKRTEQQLNVSNSSFLLDKYSSSMSA